MDEVGFETGRGDDRSLDDAKGICEIWVCGMGSGLDDIVAIHTPLSPLQAVFFG